MRWIAQVGHVAAKDARQNWWMFGIYVALLAVNVVSVATGYAIGPYRTSELSTTLGSRDLYVDYIPFLSIFAGILMSAAILQSDPPAKSTAFWASRPFSPTAVFAAKVVTAAIALVLVPAGAIVWAGRFFAADSDLLGAVVARGVFIASELLIIAFVLAALTEDLRGFVVAVVAAFLTAVTVTFTGWSVDFDDGVYTALYIGLGAITIGCALLLYSRRRRGPLVAGTGAVAATLLLLTLLRIDPYSSNIAFSDTPMSIRIEPKLGEQAGAPLMITMTPSDSASPHRITFTPESAVFTTSGTKGSRAPGIDHSRTTLADPRPPVGRDVKWIVAPPRGATNLRVLLEPEERDQILGDAQTVRLTGRAAIWRPRIIASLPFERDRSADSAGMNVLIYGLSYNRQAVEVQIRFAELDHPRRATLQATGGDDIEVAIVNDTRGEAMLLRSTVGASSDAGAIGFPWIGYTTLHRGFTSERTAPPPQSLPDDDWYKGARLVVVEWKEAERHPMTSADTPLRGRALK